MMSVKRISGRSCSPAARADAGEDRAAGAREPRLVRAVHLEHPELALDAEDAGLEVRVLPSAPDPLTRSIISPGATSMMQRVLAGERRPGARPESASP